MKLNKYLLLLLLGVCVPMGVSGEDIKPGQTIVVNVETGNEISQWIKEAREIDPFYLQGNITPVYPALKVEKKKLSRSKNWEEDPQWRLSIYGGFEKNLKGTIEYNNQGMTIPFDEVDSKGMGVAIFRAITPTLDLGLSYEQQDTETIKSSGYVYNGLYFLDQTGAMRRFMLLGRIHGRRSWFYVPFGLGYANYEETWHITSRHNYYQYNFSDRYHDDGWVGFLGLGVDLPLTHRFSFAIEGRYYFLNLDQRGDKTASIQTISGLASLNIKF